MTTSANDLLDQIRREHDAIRNLVLSGDLAALPAQLSQRETTIQQLRSLFESQPALREELRDRVEATRLEDRELIAWMIQQKEEITAAISSIRLESTDPYQEKFVGSALLDQRT